MHFSLKAVFSKNLCNFSATLHKNFLFKDFKIYIKNFYFFIYYFKMINYYNNLSLKFNLFENQPFKTTQS